MPWWLQRASRGGTILAPGDPAQSIQPIDVRNVAEFALDHAATRLPGTFNVVAPIGHDTMSGLLSACVEVTGRRGHLTWAPDDLLTAHQVKQWTELPLWRTHVGTGTASHQRRKPRFRLRWGPDCPTVEGQQRLGTELVSSGSCAELPDPLTEGGRFAHVVEPWMAQLGPHGSHALDDAGSSSFRGHKEHRVQRGLSAVEFFAQQPGSGGVDPGLVHDQNRMRALGRLRRGAMPIAVLELP
ncbi:hypothetical protein [Streptomyces cacaoi]|uniref:hypothetical protein n=1 Tax=Streptomyces cacaoi TaxID=1898 RepID=UPI001659BD5F|nr:hypothetical protein [Streptomyces cacaoi]